MIGYLASIILAALTPEAPLLDSPVPESLDPDYKACTDKVRTNVADGRRAATLWVNAGGGPPAHHCLAVADLAAGFPKLAAIRLEDLAAREEAGDALIRARLYSQAALAWLEAKEPALAEKAVGAAFAAAPDADELYLIAAKVYAAGDKQQATIDAVTTAEERGYKSADCYVLRGRALHALARHREAAEDVVNALTLDPANLDALVLRGDLYQAGIEIDAYYTDVEGNP
jgi:tetratricopeptide (TPR) repeat protein